MTNQIITPRIYVSVLADYNNGRMHGDWIDCDQPIEAVWQEIHQLYITSSDPNVTATVCKDCENIKLYEHTTCTECGSNLVKQVPSAEEYAIHDYEGFEPFDVSEYSSIEELVKMAGLLMELDDEESKHAISFLAGIYDDLETIQNKIDDVQIFYGPRGDYAQGVTEDCCDVPSYIAYYIDYDAMGRDMEINGEIAELDYDVYVTNVQDL